MKTTITFLVVLLFGVLVSCEDRGYKRGNESESTETTASSEDSAEGNDQEANPKGVGEVKNVELTEPLEESMIKSGKAIYEMKCSACHKLTDQRVVGPGWAGITNKRSPEWIMNMITNVDVMLAEDPEAQKLLEECLTRMPNQGVSIGDARDILEFMRKNDMEKVGSKDEGVVKS
ncbi:c-type cytochrome [Halocola ammonii]